VSQDISGCIGNDANADNQQERAQNNDENNILETSFEQSSETASQRIIYGGKVFDVPNERKFIKHGGSSPPTSQDGIIQDTVRTLQ
jgi:hypothetical protein